MDRNHPKTVLVTGATAGIGRFVALDLASRGHRVFATGRNEEALRTLSEEGADKGHPLETVRLDVTSPESIEAAEAIVRERTDGDGVDVIVNNAGYGQGGPLFDVTDAALRAQFDTNVFGLMAVTRAFASGMLARGRGTIVNVSSVGGRVTIPYFGAYHASKYAVESLSDSLRVELRPLGIHVAVVEPGPIRSRFSERAMEALPTVSDGSPYAQVYAQKDALRTAMDRASFSPKHVARAVRRAIGSRFPRARYVAPWFLALPIGLVPLVPTWLLDAVFRRVFGVRSRPTPALAAAAEAS